MLSNFHDTAFSVVIYLQCILDKWKVTVFKFNINNRTGYLNNFSLLHAIPHFCTRNSFAVNFMSCVLKT